VLHIAITIVTIAILGGKSIAILIAIFLQRSIAVFLLHTRHKAYSILPVSRDQSRSRLYVLPIPPTSLYP